MILNFSWCLSPAVSCAVLNKGPAAPEAGLPSPYRKHPLNWGPATTAAGLPSPSSLRDATSPKVRGLGSPPSFRFGIFTPCCRKGSRQALRLDFPPLPRAPTLGELDAVRRPERARMLAGPLAPSLAGTCDGAKSHPSPPPYSTTFSKKYQNPLDFRKLK